MLFGVFYFLDDDNISEKNPTNLHYIVLTLNLHRTKVG